MGGSSSDSSDSYINLHYGHDKKLKKQMKKERKRMKKSMKHNKHSHGMYPQFHGSNNPSAYPGTARTAAVSSFNAGVNPTASASYQYQQRTQTYAQQQPPFQYQQKQGSYQQNINQRFPSNRPVGNINPTPQPLNYTSPASYQARVQGSTPIQHNQQFFSQPQYNLPQSTPYQNLNQNPNPNFAIQQNRSLPPPSYTPPPASVAPSPPAYSEPFSSMNQTNSPSAPPISLDNAPIKPLHSPLSSLTSSMGKALPDSEKNFYGNEFSSTFTKTNDKTKEKKLFGPTVHPIPSEKFSPNDDAKLLASLLISSSSSFNFGSSHSKKIGKMLIDILPKRSQFQRNEIARQYANLYAGRDLCGDLRKELGSGVFGDLVQALMKTPAKFDSESLHKALHENKSGNTSDRLDEKVLIEILCTRDSKALDYIQNVYRAEYGHHLIEDLNVFSSKHEFRDFVQVLINILKHKREPGVSMGKEGLGDTNRAVADARLLFEAAENRSSSSVDYSVFVEIFSFRSDADLNNILIQYERISSEKHGQDLRKAIHEKFSNTSQSCLKRLLICMIDIARSRSTYFARLFQKSMKGLGTRDSLLIRLIVSRSEIDLDLIKQEFLRRDDISKGENLAKWIEDDTSGNYRKMLLALL